MQIIGQFSDDRAADESPADPARAERNEPERIAREFDATIRPLHPGTTDPVLRRYFVIDVGHGVSAETLAERLRGAAGVDGAYLKSPGEPP